MRLVKGFAIILVAMFAATSSFAASKTANFAVTATINPACAITAAPLAFGVYDPLGVNKTTALAGQTNVTIQCVAELGALVSLDEGLYKGIGSSSTIPVRRMQCLDVDGEFLNYNLYQEVGHTTLWGAGASGFSIIADGTSHDYPVFGLIPGGQVLEDGGFSDTIVATVSY